MLGDPADLAGRLPVYGRDFAFQRADGTPSPSDDRPGLRALRGERIANLQLLLDRPAGAPLPVAVHAAPLHIDAEPAAEAIVVLQDVTVLRQAEQLKDDFLALVSHELRTPLTAIHGGARLLASAGNDLPAAQRQELLDDVVQESGRLDRLLANLLALAEILAGRLPVMTEPVLLPPFVRQVAVAAQTRHRSHAFVVDLSPALPPLEADPALLEEVLANLYDNAVKYSPVGGEIRTTATASAGRIALTVHDQGVGIAPEHVALGLYLSRLLIEAQGGAIAAASAGPDQGSAFTITLPIADGWTEPETTD
jgi:K+-sensing histidine kinase KdpD